MSNATSNFDLDVQVTTASANAGPYLKSWILCTAGCTSPGGGSMCSWCC